MTDDLLSDMLNFLGDDEPPSTEDGWASFAELHQASKGLTDNQLRERLRKMVSAGKLEQRIWSRQAYYRKAKA